MKFVDIPKKLYFVGIGGVSMSGIAQHLKTLGYDVCGSDRTQSPATQKLQKMGIAIHIGETEKIDAEMVIKTSAIKNNHPQILDAKSRNIPVVLREEILGAIFDTFTTRICVCGTHGKTTVTAMIHHVLHCMQITHTAFIGGNYKGQNYIFGKEIVVAEGCEYNASFLHMHPTHTLCLNVEWDHPDCYKNLQEVESAFTKLFEQSQKVITTQKCSYNNKKCTLSIPFCAQGITFNANGTTFKLYHNGRFISHCYLPTVGEHNVNNALSTIALCHSLDLPITQVCDTLSTFCGVERRWTKVDYKCCVICDYAHHPTEIQATLLSTKNIAKGRIICLFQPHTFTRTQAFWEQFATCFGTADSVIYLPIFPAREIPIDGITSQNLCNYANSIGINAIYLDSFDNAVSHLQQTLTPTDTLLILGAGDVLQVADMLCKKS